MNPIDALMSVLCDPEGKCCIAVSDADRAIVDEAISALQAALAEPTAEAKAIAAAYERGWRAALVQATDARRQDVLDSLGLGCVAKIDGKRITAQEFYKPPQVLTDALAGGWSCATEAKGTGKCARWCGHQATCVAVFSNRDAEGWEIEAGDIDRALECMGCDPAEFRTEGGHLRYRKFADSFVRRTEPVLTAAIGWSVAAGAMK